VRDHVHPGGPRIGKGREDQLPGIKDGGRGIAQEGYAAIFLGLPEGEAPSPPFLLDSKVEGVVVVAGVAEAELPVMEED
jgi:hypothetical protein